MINRDILCEQALITNRSLSKTTGNRERGRVPRWRLAREGPFTNERSQASLRVLGKGCAFRHTTYSAEDHAPPEGGLGVPLNHPHFLEWLGAPESAWLLEMSPGQWCDTLSRDQAMTAAMRLHRDTCLMKTNLDERDGLQDTTKDNWMWPIPESGGSSSSAGPASTSSFGPHGGIRALETLVGPDAVWDATS